VIVVEVILISIVLLWCGSFFYNFSYFFNSKDSEIDFIFKGLKSFDQAENNLSILESLTGKSQVKAAKRIAYYKKNARLTKRKFSYYRDYIDPYFLRVYLNEFVDYKKNISVFKKLDSPIKFHFIIICISLILLMVALDIYFFYKIGLAAIFPIVFFLFLGFIIFFFLIRVNYVIFYLVVDGLLILFKKDRGKLGKNIALLDFISSKRIYGRSSGTVISSYGAVGYSGVSSFSGGGSSFGGFGGGSFGGGGAGGSW